MYKVNIKSVDKPEGRKTITKVYYKVTKQGKDVTKECADINRTDYYKDGTTVFYVEEKETVESAKRRLEDKLNK